MWASLRRSVTWTCKATTNRFEPKQDVSARLSPHALPLAAPVEATIHDPEKQSASAIEENYLLFDEFGDCALVESEFAQDFAAVLAVARRQAAH